MTDKTDHIDLVENAMREALDSIKEMIGSPIVDDLAKASVHLIRHVRDLEVRVSALEDQSPATGAIVSSQPLGATRSGNG